MSVNDPSPEEDVSAVGSLPLPIIAGWRVAGACNQGTTARAPVFSGAPSILERFGNGARATKNGFGTV
jgi:hypothetical protein